MRWAHTRRGPCTGARSRGGGAPLGAASSLYIPNHGSLSLVQPVLSPLTTTQTIYMTRHGGGGDTKIQTFLLWNFWFAMVFARWERAIMYIFPLRLSNIFLRKIDLTGKWSEFRRFRSGSMAQRKNGTNISLQRNISKPNVYTKKYIRSYMYPRSLWKEYIQLYFIVPFIFCLSILTQ